MSNHFVSINRGKSGTSVSDFTFGTSSTSGDDIELRLADAASLTRKDIVLALEALERVYSSGGPAFTTFPKL